MKKYLIGFALGLLFAVVLSKVFAEPLQVTPEGCISFGESAMNIAQARKDKVTLEDAYKTYDESLSKPDRTDWTHTDALIYKLIKDQIKEIYSWSDKKFNPLSPMDIGNSFIKECMQHKGNFNVILDLET